MRKLEGKAAGDERVFKFIARRASGWQMQRAVRRSRAAKPDAVSIRRHSGISWHDFAIVAELFYLNSEHKQVMDDLLTS